MNRLAKTLIKLFIGCFAILLLVACLAYLFWFRALSFERKYLEQAPQQAHQVRSAADARSFYLGGSTDRIDDLTSGHFSETFNSSTPTNRLKLGSILQLPSENQSTEQLDFNFAKTDEWLNVALQQGIRVRGHTLVWGRLSDDYQDPDLQTWLDRFDTEKQKRQQLRALVENQIEQTLNHYRGKIKQWDVINEPLELLGEGELDDNVYSRYIGEDYIEVALQHAHQIDPTVKLYINEQLHNYTGSKAQAFYDLVRNLIDRGIPIHGVGLQHHMLFHLESAESTKQYMLKLQQLGLELEITELDARLRLFKSSRDPYQAQGEYYASIVKACLEVSACKGVTFWGLDDRQSWHDEVGFIFPGPNEPYLFDAELNPKPGVGEIFKVLTQ